jgi:4'-phosphopantetheinyl transferase
MSIPKWSFIDTSSPITLPNNEIHVWRAWLDQASSQFEFIKTNLTDGELIKAMKYVFERDRKRFIVSRGVLRLILASYLGIEPIHIQLSYGAQGKPLLEGSTNRENKLEFNLSHSENLVLYSITGGYRIGIDLEKIRPIPEIDRIAENFFSYRENIELSALPVGLQEEAFFNCWTRKEAYLKACGAGLSTAPDSLEVSLVPGEPAALLNVARHPNEASQWSLFSLLPAPGYVAAIAVQRNPWHLRFFQWGEISELNG